MADRVVYQIDVESPDFDKFSKQFDEYSAKLKETHESWKSIGDQINQVTDSFTKSSGLPKQAQETSKKLSPIAEMFGKMQNNVGGMTKAFDAWPKMLKPISGLLGGGLVGLGAGLGLAAITQMFSQLMQISAKVMDTGRAARGQGIGYGAYTAFKGLGKEVVSDPQAALNAVATARYDVASEQRRAFNVMFGKGTQKELQKGPEAIFDFMEQAQKRLKQYPEQVRATQAQALGLTSVAAFGDIMAYDPKARAAQKKAQEEVAKHTDLSKEQQAAVTDFWRTFQTKMEETSGGVDKFWANFLLGLKGGGLRNLLPHRHTSADDERNRRMGYDPKGAFLKPDGSSANFPWPGGGLGAPKPATPAPAAPALPATVGAPAQAPAAPAGAAPTTRAPAGKPSWNPFHWGRSTPARPQQEQMAAPSMAIAGAQSKVEESMSWVKSWFSSETSATKAATRAAESRDRTLMSLMDDLKVFFEDKGSKLGTWASPAADNPAASTVGATGNAMLLMKYGAQALRLGGPAAAGLGIAAAPGLTGPLTPGGMKGAIASDDAERKKFYDFFGGLFGGGKPQASSKGLQVASLGDVDPAALAKLAEATKDNTDTLKKFSDETTTGKDWASARYGGGGGLSTGGGAGGGGGALGGGGGGGIGGGGGGPMMAGLGGLPGFGGGGAGDVKSVFPAVHGGALMQEVQKGAAATPGGSPTDIRVGTQGPGAIGGGAAGDFIRKQEGLSLKTYNDVGHLATGYGHDFTAKELSQGFAVGASGEHIATSGRITKDQADDLFKADYTSRVQQVSKQVPGFDKLNSNQQEAVMSYYYNTGRTPRNLAANIQSGNMGAVSESLRTGINTAKGQVLPVLTRRRADEAKLFNTAPAAATATAGGGASIVGGGGSSGGGGASGDWASGAPAVKPPGSDVGGGMTGGEQAKALGGIPNADALLADVKAKNPHMSNEQCVTLVRSYANMGGTVRDWRRGENIMTAKDIPIGTPMATFMSRRGQQSDKYDAGEGVGAPGAGTTHAALFGGYTYDEKGNRTGIKAVEQYTGSRGPHVQSYRQGGGFGERDAANYEVINTAAGQPYNQPKQQPQQTAMAQPSRPATPTPQKPGPMAMDHWQSPDRGPSVKIHNQTGSDVFINSSILASA